MSKKLHSFSKGFKRARKSAGYTQASFAEASHRFNWSISLDTVRNWEQGKSTPSVDTLIKLCDFFQCDMDYLFSDIDCKTHDTQFVVDYTGLSEHSVSTLNRIHSFLPGDNDIPVINVLLHDLTHATPAKVSGKPHTYRSILHLLNLFFSYQNSREEKQAFINGTVTSIPSDGYTSENAIKLTDRVIENAILMEIQQALIHIKENNIALHKESTN